MMLLLEVWSECRDSTSRIHFKNEVETFLNTGVFGMVSLAAQWTLPTTINGKELDSVTFSNW